MLFEAGGSFDPHNTPILVLSDEVVLAYVLDHSGCVGHLTAGRVERVGARQLKVYDKHGAVFEFLSRGNLRSWCVCREDGKALDGWSEILEEDVQRIGPLANGPSSKA
jgi:hypothetical protein